MAQLIGRGLIGGHAATYGWWSEEFEEAILSYLEARTGLTPILRAKLDLDGNGSFEVIELDKLDNVGNISRAIEYTTNKPSFGSSSLRLHNCDGRYTDNWAKSLTYFDPASPTRYHMRRVVIEVGFDWVFKHLEKYWIPIFEGFIVSKTEDAESRTVSISLMDEWKKILDYNLAPIKPADEVIDYDTASDVRRVQLGTFYGKHEILKLEKTNKDDQILIPTVANTAGAATTASVSYDQYFLWAPAAGNKSDLPNYMTLDTLDASNNVIEGDVDIWFWGWDSSWFADSLQQWMRLPRYDGVTQNYTLSVDGDFVFLRAINTNLNFKNVDGSAIAGTVDLDAYFDTADTDAENLDADIRIAATSLESNPVKALYLILKNQVGLDTDDMDASGTDPDNWSLSDIDYDNENFFSFDSSAIYLTNQGMNACIHVDEETPCSDLIDNICELTRGGFFVDKGVEKVGEKANRRIRFVIHEPRKQPPSVRKLSEERLHDPTITRSISDVKNSISVSNFDFNSDNDKFSDIENYFNSDSDSINIYGQKDLIINTKPGDITFLYSSDGYAQFLSSHFLKLFKEPPIIFGFETDLLGMNWDLKNLVAIKETEQLNLDYDEDTDLSGLFEIYNLNFNTDRFYFSYEALWAGYLVMPDGNINRRWAFADDSYANNDPESASNFGYYAW